MGACLGCHDGRTAPNACPTCHRGDRPKEDYKTGSWSTIHLDADGTAHGMGDLDSCESCHSRKKCVGCHLIELPHTAGFPRTHGKQAMAEPKSCPQCHERDACDGCHGTRMPHPTGFLASHSKGVRDEQDPKCIKCHRQDDCDDCHVKHSHPGKQTGYTGPYW